MAKQSFVRQNHYSSTDWHDMASVVDQMQQNGSYEIQDPETYIATDIYNYIKDMVSSEVTVDTIKEIMNGNDDAFIETVVPTRYEENGITNVRPDRIEIFSKAHSGFGYQPHFDSVDYTNVMQYHIDEIEPEKVAYLVSEHVVNPGKGSDLLERVYHEPFDSLEEAIAYQTEQMKDYVHEGCAWSQDSGFKISIVDKEAILQDSWYKDNMLALDYIDKLGLNPADYRFYRSAHGVVETLQEQAYDASSPAEKLSIDKDVYSRFKEYLSVEHQRDIDLMLQACESKFATTSSREIVDRALILAHIDATSQADYDAIHKSLGEYDCRLAQLTRKNVKEMRGHGDVCITKDGDIGYFKNAYGINSWEGSKDNPYHGTMFSNMGNTVEILRDFRHHDKFVDTLPSAEEVDKYYEQYMDWEHQQAEIREKASVEYKIERKNGKSYVVAPGYSTLEPTPYGNSTIKTYHSEPISFAAKWGNHTFTDDEIRSLLIGKNITIEGYRNNMGEELNVSGELQRLSYNGHSYMGFNRTDMHDNFIHGAGKFYIECDSPNLATAARQKVSDIVDHVGDALGIDDSNKEHGVFISEATEGKNGKYYFKVAFIGHKDHPMSLRKYCDNVKVALSEALRGETFQFGKQQAVNLGEIDKIKESYPSSIPTYGSSILAKAEEKLNESLLTEQSKSADKSMGLFE